MALTVKHLFPFLKLMKALNIKEEFKEIMRSRSKVDEEVSSEILEDKGVDMIFMLFEKMPNAEKEIKEFLAMYSGKTYAEIEELPVDEFIEIIKQFFREDSFKSFFTRAVK